MRCTVISSIVLVTAITGVAFHATYSQQHREQSIPSRTMLLGRFDSPMVFGGIEQLWAAINFELNVDSATLRKVSLYFQQAWNERKKLLSESAGNLRAIATGMARIRVQLNEKLKTALTPEQMKKLTDWEKSQIQRTSALVRQLKRSGFRGGAIRSPAIENPLIPKSADEERILSVIKELEQYRRRFQNVPPKDGRLLRLLTEAIGAKHVVEIGTSNGYSGLWFCLALRATGGKLTTYEINHQRVLLARENFKKAGVSDIVTIVEGDAHKEVTKLKEPIDILFLDADKSGYVDYLNKLLPLIRPGGLIIAHNMRYPPPDPRYIKAITTNPNLETIFLHMDGPGIGVTLKKRERR